MPRDTWWNLPSAKRERVLDAAMLEFGHRGFSAGSLNVVARTAGVAKGSIFQYFEDKLDLFTTTCGAAADRISGEVMGGLSREAGQTFFDLLGQVSDRWISYFATHPLEGSVALAASNEMDPDARAAVRSVTNARFLEVLQPLVKEAADHGDLRTDVDPAEVIAMVVLVLRHLDSAPFVPHIDPLLGLYGRPVEEVQSVARRLIGALERAYAA